MAGLKKNSWCVPSFDCDYVSTNKSLAKRTGSVALDDDLPEELHVQHGYQRRRHEVSLSKLLEICEPRKLSELAISRQKQNEISNWFQHKTCMRQPSVLVLSGPSGCGKTTGVKLIAKENGFDIVEWITPIDSAEDENRYVTRQRDRFKDHLLRTTRYHAVFGTCSKQLLLVKDLPNVYQEDQTGFFALLENYFEVGKQPVLFVCTETRTSKLLQTLFAPAIREKFGIDLININAATQTAMKNVLKRVMNTLNSTAGDMLNVTQRHIDEILSNSIGDVRSAVLNLIFVSLKVPKHSLKSECGVREETLGLLHGVGRVINPKKLPDSDFCRFTHDPEEMAGFFQSYATVFIQFLQENYLNTMRIIDDVIIGSDILSLVDVFNSEWHDRNSGKIALSFCIRGLMLANEKPVSNWNPVRKPRNDRNNTRQCLATAETQWYESIIKSASKGTDEMLHDDIDIFIED